MPITRDDFESLLAITGRKEYIFLIKRSPEAVDMWQDFLLFWYGDELMLGVFDWNTPYFDETDVVRYPDRLPAGAALYKGAHATERFLEIVSQTVHGGESDLYEAYALELLTLLGNPN